MLIFFELYDLWLTCDELLAFFRQCMDMKSAVFQPREEAFLMVAVRVTNQEGP